MHELSQLLDCGLDRRAVQILMALIDAGVHPTALVRVAWRVACLSRGSTR